MGRWGGPSFWSVKRQGPLCWIQQLFWFCLVLFVCLFLQTPSLGEQFKAHNPEWGILIFTSTVNPYIPPSHPVHVTQNTQPTHTIPHTHAHTQHIHSPHNTLHANHTGICTNIHTHATCTYHTLHYTQHTHTTCTHMHSAWASSGRSPGNLLSSVCLPRAFQPVPAVRDTHPALSLCSLWGKSTILPPAAPRGPAPERLLGRQTLR